MNGRGGCTHDPCKDCRSLRAQVARLEGEKAEMAAALRTAVTLIDYKEHAFGEPEVDDGDYLKSLHDWLPQGRAALAVVKGE